MKNLFFVIGFICISQAAHAQFFSFGLKGGVNTQVKKPQDIIINNGDTSFHLGVDKYKFGTQFGIWAKIGSGLFFQPELVFNSNRTDYVVGESSANEVIRNERYNYLDLPLMAGLSLGPLRVMAGPVGHYFLSSKSELADFDGYEERFKQMTWGWQLGAGLGFGRLSADIRYEGNFSKQGNHMTFFGDQYEFSNRPSRILISLNYALIKV